MQLVQVNTSHFQYLGILRESWGRGPWKKGNNVKVFREFQGDVLSRGRRVENSGISLSKGLGSIPFFSEGLPVPPGNIRRNGEMKWLSGAST